MSRGYEGPAMTHAIFILYARLGFLIKRISF